MKQFIIGVGLGLATVTASVFAAGPGNIYPFFGNVGINTESPSRPLTVVSPDGYGGNYLASFTNENGTPGKSSGVLIQAGINSDDLPLVIKNHEGKALFVLRGDGGLEHRIGEIDTSWQPLTIVSPDGTDNENYMMKIVNNEETPGESNGPLIQAGNDGRDLSLVIKNRAGDPLVTVFADGRMRLFGDLEVHGTVFAKKVVVD